MTKYQAFSIFCAVLKQAMLDASATSYRTNSEDHRRPSQVEQQDAIVWLMTTGADFMELNGVDPDWFRKFVKEHYKHG